MIDKIIAMSTNRREFLKYLTGAFTLLLAGWLGLSEAALAGDSKAGKDAAAMKKYVCTVCGYVYEPAKGDSYYKIPPGTPFEKLPAYWVCPQCGAEKSAFVVYE
jgi:rubredoxin